MSDIAVFLLCKLGT